MYGGFCHYAYFQSALNLKEQFIFDNVRHDWLVLWNESAVHRARNQIAHTFLKSPYEWLFFIDADIQFSVADAMLLLSHTQDEDKNLLTGVYPMKKPGAPYAAWKNGTLIDNLDQFDGKLTEVDYAGTGFLLIHREVFEEIQPFVPTYIGPNNEEYHRYFAFEIEEVHGAAVELSEDYYFCKRAREQGIPTVMDPSIRLIHHGTYGYGYGSKPE